MENFQNILAQIGLDHYNSELIDAIEKTTPADVEKALADKTGYNLHKLAALLSPAADKYLEQMAQKAQRITRQRFGNTIQLYAPLYVSNFCVNSCPYCAFNIKGKFTPSRLTIEQACKGADILAEMGFRHILLVSGEDKKFVTTDYLTALAAKLRKKFSSISIEIYPADQADYEKLFAAGIDGIALYQETYDRDDYKKIHTAGPKADYEYRLETLQRAGNAGFRSLGIGFLIGLSDWRMQTLAMAAHADFLMKHYWQSKVSFSFPRMRPAENVNRNMFRYMITDRQLVQMMTALRLCFSDAEIVLSTRENAQFRDNVSKICITRISAGSKTNPGGYTDDSAVEQFEVADARSPAEVSQMLKQAGLEPVWKDWDSAFAG
ncbi:MAG TPA: 2-iminoacetate synthase ThiH [Phycisphaerales bacterium]|nr:MAG: thiamine biosynthesis protein ThiH [Planctomycetes bacterium GWC2_45_44]HBG77990.1 2-iminoacetate synthase ThiH [Phycisphaerales bacterium]HBR19885.1 2-iminoacetate synthase ThiH [Phycisphaerales bacterium]